MSDPQRLLERGEGLAATMLRAGREERPSSERMRRTLMAIGVTSVVGSAAGEAAGGGAGAIGSGLAGSTAAKVTASSISLAFAAKWVVIGGLGGLVTVGAATELSAPRFSAAQGHPAEVTRSLLARPTLPAEESRERTMASAPFVRDDSTEPVSRASEAPMHGRESASARALFDLESNGRGGSPVRASTPGLSAAAKPSEVLARPARSSEPTTSIALGDLPRLASAELGAPALPLAGPVTRAPTMIPSHPPQGADAVSASEGVVPAQSASGELSVHLNNQVTLIDGAWAAMKRKDPSGALRALSDYERAFPFLELHPEVLFLRMTAQDALGQRRGARADAGRIVALYPGSAQARRARELLARP